VHPAGARDGAEAPEAADGGRDSSGVGRL